MIPFTSKMYHDIIWPTADPVIVVQEHSPIASTVGGKRPNYSGGQEA